MKKRLLAGLCLCAALFAGLSAFALQQTSAETAQTEVGAELTMAETAVYECLLTLDGGSWSTAEGSGHLQGICCDDELQYMYFSFTDRLIKVDMRTGERVGTVTGLKAGSISSGAHLGCLAYYDGYIYGSLEYKAQKRWYVAAFDAEKIVGDVNYADPGVMYAIHVPDVDEEYQDELDAGEHNNSASSMGHKYGTGGIDGITFATLPGAGLDSKVYMLVTYGPYGNTERYDNNNQVLLAYDPEKIPEYLLPFSEDRTEAEGLRFEQQLFVYTGNQTYGIQNLEYDKETGDLWMMCYGRPSGSLFPSGNMYVIDGSVPLYMDEVEVGQSVPETSEDYAAAQSKAACYMVDGAYPQANHMTLKCTCSLGGLENHEETVYGDTGHAARICIDDFPASAATGFISLGNDYYYVASSGSETVDGVTYQWGEASLYKLDRDGWGFTRVAAPAKLLLSYTMDAADTYEMGGQVYLKDASGGGHSALVEGTYAAEDMNGNAGGALGFRGYLQGAVFDQVSASGETMAFLNEEIEGAFSYSFWVYNEQEMDRFTPIIGMYRDEELQKGLYAGVFEWRYRNSPAVTTHRYTSDPDYRTLADGTIYIARPGTNGGDASVYPHGQTTTNLMDQWRHYVVVRVGSTVTVYCNGETTSVSGAGVSDDTLDNLSAFVMGGAVTKNWKDTNNRTRFSGRLDDVRIYSGAITPEEAAALYEAGPAVSDSTGTGAVSGERETAFSEPYTGEILSEQEEPIVHYLMDGAGSVADVSGNGVHAAATEYVVLTENADGQEGRALSFDGFQYTRPSRVAMTDEDTAWLSAQLNGTGKVTISFWMKADHENGHRMAILGLYDKSGRPMGVFETRGKLGQDIMPEGKFAIGFAAAKPYESGVRDEKTYEQLCVTDTTTYTSNGTSGQYGDKLVGQWYHVVGELDQTANTMRLYVDGELAGEISISSDTLDEIGYFLIGTSAGRYYEYENASNSSENTSSRQGWAMRGDYVGAVDDVRIYNRILSGAEVEELYRAGTAARVCALSELSVLDGEGTALTTLPEDSFTARVTARTGGAAVVILAAYSEDGQMVEIHCLEAGGGEEPCTLEAQFLNEGGCAVSIKAFLVTSLTEPAPLCAGLEFEAE